MVTTISGTLYRAGSDPHEQPATWNVPDTVRLTVNFDRPIGEAQLTQLPDGTIEATCVVRDDDAHHLFDRPYLGAAMARRDDDQVDVIGAAVIAQNLDAELPPYTVVTDDAKIGEMLGQGSSRRQSSPQ